MSNEEDVSRVKIRFIIEGIGEAEGEFIRFLSPRSVDTIVRKLPLEGLHSTKKKSILKFLSKWEKKNLSPP